MGTAVSTSGAPSGAASEGTPADAYRWFLAWGVALLAIALINRSRLGHVIVYYVLVLMLAFLFVTQARWFASALLPLSKPGSVKLHSPVAEVTSAGATIRQTARTYWGY